MTRTTGSVPDLVSPMQVSAGSGQPPTGPDWVVELAWTGHRCIAYVEPGRRTRLLSSGDVSVSAAYPELAAPLEARSPPRGMVLDGTIVARGEEHAPRPRLLKRRSGRSRPTDQLIRATPVDYQVADLLFLDGHSTVDLPYRDRRALLDGLGFDSAPVWTTSPLPVSELTTMLRIAAAKGVDALHARHLGSRYKPGGRSPLWLKVPVPRVRQVVVGGWTPTDPARPDAIASLLLGVPAGSGLRYVGRVGVAGDQRRLIVRLRTITSPSSPFVDVVPTGAARGAIWVQPQFVGLVEFTGFAADGRLRLPHWRGPVEPGPGGVDLDDLTGSRWARPSVAPPRRAEQAPTPASSPIRSGEFADPARRVRETAPAPDPDSGPDTQPSDGDPSGARSAEGAEPVGAQSAGPESAGPESAGPESAGPESAGPESAGGAQSAAAQSAAAQSAGTQPSGTPSSGTRSAGTRSSGAQEAETPTAALPVEPAPAPAGMDRAAPAVEARRLEQHFVYNALNTIAALIRTDPARARELLFGFADLSRAADQPGDGATTLGRELDAVRGYLQLEQARFGKRLRVELDVHADLHALPVIPLRVLDAVRVAVQRDIEPRPQGGVLTITAEPTGQGCLVTVVGGAGPPTVIELPLRPA